MTESKLLRVEWEDIVAGNSWDEAKDLPKPHLCVSVGWLIVDDPEYLTLAGTFGQHQDAEKKIEYNQTISIPRGVVKNVTEIHG